MTTPDFSTTLVLDQPPEVVFDAINRVREWWSEEIEGSTEKVNDVFNYHYKDVHKSKMKLIEVIPNKRVVWLVLDNYFKFTKDKTEWNGNKIIFEITEKDNKTHLQFTQTGLVPSYDCYDICREAWSNYINNSLRSLITTGKGQPNAKESEFDDQLLMQHNINMQEQHYHTTLTVDAPAVEVFKSINSVTKWWTENLEGSSQNPDDKFTVRFDEVHMSTQKLVEVVPDKKVVWLVTDSKLNFITDRDEWTNTKIVFEIAAKDGKTEIDFTHIGLVPKIECYNSCTKGWDYYIKGSLFKLLTEGKGMSEMRQKETTPVLSPDQQFN